MLTAPRNYGRRLLIAASMLVLAPLSAQSQEASSDYLSRPDVQAFIQTLHEEHGLEPLELERVLGQARHQPTVVRLIGPEPQPQTKPVVRSYPAYRAKFLTAKRIAAGTHYWERNEKYLRRAEIEFGVPAEVILGILGVETAFGQNTGSFRALDALTTIAFDGPRRQDYFREELKELFLLARDTGLDPLAIKGSYAGAVGLPQFMPSSYRRYAVDFDNDGTIDLLGSAADAIGSIASYLKSYGWISGEPWRVPVRIPAGREAELVSGLQRVHAVADLRAQGVKFTTSGIPERSPCAIVELPSPGKQASYVAAFDNFEAITRYNRSTFYATAVLDLADAIRTARTRQVAAASRPKTTSSG